MSPFIHPILIGRPPPTARAFASTMSVSPTRSSSASSDTPVAQLQKPIVECLTVGHSGRAIAEADLGAHVDLNPCPAVGRRAYKRPPEAPLIERERPLRFSPNRFEDGLIRGRSRARHRQRPGNSSDADNQEQ